MAGQTNNAGFDAVVLAHLDDAFNLASWILRDPSDAQDAVQDSMVRALKYFPSFRGANAKAWVLQIVRNTAYGMLKKRQNVTFIALAEEQDPDAAERVQAVELVSPDDSPELQLSKHQELGELDRMLTELPVEQRECLILKELEDMSYQEIAEITDTPIGTVMSRLWRARQALMKAAQRSLIAS